MAGGIRPAQRQPRVGPLRVAVISQGGASTGARDELVFVALLLEADRISDNPFPIRSRREPNAVEKGWPRKPGGGQEGRMTTQV